MSPNIRPLPPAKPFEFLEVALPADGDLRLVLTECTPAESSPWGVPPYSFRMQNPGGEDLGRIRLRVDAGAERKKMCFRLALQ